MSSKEPLDFEGTTATASYDTPIGCFLVFVGCVGAFALFWGYYGLLGMSMSRSGSLIGAAFGLLLILVPVVFFVSLLRAPIARRMVFDAAAREIRIVKRWPWQGGETVEAIPFSVVRSVGVLQMGTSGNEDVNAVLWLHGVRREIKLWPINFASIFQRGAEEEPVLGYSMAVSDRALQRLTELTGLRREDDSKAARRAGWGQPRPDEDKT